ncbi:hypothetical protein H920_15354 [Fukomys damarensis]|uniref:Uncharacterized protein n=1 Tax=Fukomys damarensis TaxID=885580 RepID=A0A091CUK1_FUKDA|nr:hypothetical protein H920_15354 [Fukomys damarensis]
MGGAPRASAARLTVTLRSVGLPDHAGPSLPLASERLQRVDGERLRVEDSCPLLPEHSPKLLRPSKANSFDDYHKTLSHVASLGIPQKATFAIARSRFARESRVPSSVSLSGEMNHLCPTPEEHPTESQPELDHVTETHETEDV